MYTGENENDEYEWDFIKQGGLDTNAASHSHQNGENTGQLWGSQTKQYVESVLAVPQKHTDNVGTYNNNFNTDGSGTRRNYSVTLEQCNIPVKKSNSDNSVDSVQSTERTLDFGNSRNLIKNNYTKFSSPSSTSSHDVRSDHLNTIGAHATSQSSSDSNVNNKQRLLESSKKRYDCIERSKLYDNSDNRLNMGNERVLPSVSAGEFAYFPSPNDSNIRIDPIHPPGKAENPRPNEGSSPRNNGTDRSREETGSRTQQRAPSTVFCLDVSENMRGKAFQEMITTTKTIVTGLQAVAISDEENAMLQENIAIATFGHETKVLMHLTQDYEGILSKIDALTPGGTCNMKEGLAMALTAFSGHSEGWFLSKVVMISNGNASLENAESATGGKVTEAVEVDAGQVLQEFIKLSVRIFCIPVGEARLIQTALKDISEVTGGKIIQTCHTYRIVSMTKALLLGWEVAGSFDETVNREARKAGLRSIGYRHSDDEMENILDQIEYINTRLVVKEDTDRCKYEECDPSMPNTGARVRRGPHWKQENQDSDGVGTIIGHHKKGVLWVEWDTGIRGTYIYTETEHEVVVVREQRTLFPDQMVAVGCLVKRGKDWNHGNVDGGPENTGVVLRVVDDGSVLVRWQNQGLHRYKFGYDGIFEVEICNHISVLEHQPVPLPPAPGPSPNTQFSNCATEQVGFGTQNFQRVTKSSYRPETQVNKTHRGVASYSVAGNSTKTHINKENIRNVPFRSNEKSSLSSSSSSSSSQKKEQAAKFTLLEERQHVWQYQSYQHHNSEWVSYPPDLQIKIESAYTSHRKTTVVDMNGLQLWNDVCE